MAAARSVVRRVKGRAPVKVLSGGALEVDSAAGAGAGAGGLAGLRGRKAAGWRQFPVRGYRLLVEQLG